MVFDFSKDKLCFKTTKNTLIKLSTTFFLIVLLFSQINVGYSAKEGDFSLYTRSSEVMKVFGNELAPKEDSIGTSKLLDGGIRTGQAGGLVGYANITKDDKLITNWITSALSTSSATFSYDQLGLIENSKGTAKDQLRSYGEYGRSLSTLGLDRTVTSGVNIGAYLFGLIMQCLYTLSSAVPFIFNVAIRFLKIINPFKLFGLIFTNDTFASIPGIGPLKNYLTYLYDTLINFSEILVIPMFIAVTLFTVIISKKANASKRFARLFLRVFMIFVGVPLIGATYTSVLNFLDDNTSGHTSFGNYIVYSSFVDFEAWAKNTRLAPPSDNKIDSEKANSTIQIGNRNLVLEINTIATKDTDLKNLYSSIAGRGLEAAYDKNLVIPDNDKADDKAKDLLKRYTSSETFTSSTYEGYVKSDIHDFLSISKSKDEAKAVNTMFSLVGDDILDAQSLFTDSGPTNGSAKDFSMLKGTIYNAGSLTRNNYVYGLANGGDPMSGKKSGVPSISKDSSSFTGSGLSPLAMYNYLNTDFESSSMTVYSSEKASSGFVKQSHRSVSLAGNGFGGVIFGLESLVMLLITVIVSLFYAFAFIKVGVNSVPKILSGIFGTTFGSIPAITKLLVSVAVIMVEILGSIILFTVSELLIVSVLSSFDSWFSGIDVLPVLDITFAIIKIMVGLVVAWFSIKNRAVFVKILEELTNSSIGKIMQGLDLSTDDNSNFGNNREAISLAAAGAGAGAGMLGSGNKNDNAPTGLKDRLGETIGQVNDKAHAVENATGRKMTMGEKMKLGQDTLAKRTKSGFKDDTLKALGLEGKNLARDDKDFEADIRAYERANSENIAKTVETETSGSGFDPNEYKGDDKDANGNVLNTNGGNLNPDSADSEAPDYFNGNNYYDANSNIESSEGEPSYLGGLETQPILDAEGNVIGQGSSGSRLINPETAEQFDSPYQSSSGHFYNNNDVQAINNSDGGVTRNPLKEQIQKDKSYMSNHGVSDYSSYRNKLSDMENQKNNLKSDIDRKNSIINAMGSNGNGASELIAERNQMQSQLKNLDRDMNTLRNVGGRVLMQELGVSTGNNAMFKNGVFKGDVSATRNNLASLVKNNDDIKKAHSALQNNKITEEQFNNFKADRQRKMNEISKEITRTGIKSNSLNSASNIRNVMDTLSNVEESFTGSKVK